VDRLVLAGRFGSPQTGADEGLRKLFTVYFTRNLYFRSFAREEFT
jgi:hypothetical protein